LNKKIVDKIIKEKKEDNNSYKKMCKAKAIKKVAKKLAAR